MRTRISPNTDTFHAVRMWENTNQNNSEYGQFLRNLLVKCEKIRVKFDLFSQISRAKRSFCKYQFLLFEKTFIVKLFYANKGKIISSCVKGLSMEIEPYCNECVESNILQKFQSFLPIKVFTISLGSSVLYRLY